MISVIIPVYNVSEYIDECVESIVHQTYKDIEILLINDGSTDDSGEKCHVWAEKDKRIKVIDKKNEGQAVCRNIGVRLAKGELITFVDSDDWIHVTMLEELFNAMKVADADIAMCEAYTQQANGKFSRYSLQHLEQPVIDIQKEPEFLLTVRYTMWSKIYKKSLFIENEIEEPSIKFEDFATVPIVYALSKKIACVDKALYYYRYRDSSTVRDVSYAADRIKALEYMMRNFETRDMVCQWYEILKRIYIERGLILMRQIYPLISKYFKICCTTYDEQLKKYFQMQLKDITPRFQVQCLSGNVGANILGKYELGVFGSYNLMIIAKIMMNIGMPDYLEEHYSFSSLISVFSKVDELFYDIDLWHKSSFRRKHLIQDFKKTLACKNKCEFKNTDYFLIDFLEERYDVGEVNGCYFTISEAFMDIQKQIKMKYRIINKYSEEAKTLWKQSCIKFIKYLRKHMEPGKVIIVRTLLAKGYGVAGRVSAYFSNIEEIQKTNALLNEYYDFFIENMPEALVIETEGEFYYTDETFRHGCEAWHLNDGAYWNLNIRILNKIKERGGEVTNETLLKNEETYRQIYKEIPDNVKHKQIVIWYGEKLVDNSVSKTLNNILRCFEKTPTKIITTRVEEKKECYSLVIEKDEILKDHSQKFFIIISSLCNYTVAAESLKAFGYREGIDFCRESILDN